MFKLKTSKTYKRTGNPTTESALQLIKESQKLRTMDTEARNQDTQQDTTLLPTDSYIDLREALVLPSLIMTPEFKGMDTEERDLQISLKLKTSAAAIMTKK